MYKIIKDTKIVGVSEDVPSLLDEYEIVEDIEHTTTDYIQYNGEFILKDSEEAIELEKEKVLAIRDEYFDKYVDWYQSKPLLWEEMTAKEKQLIGDYRIYLRDYDDRELWWEQEPMTYDEWVERKN